MDVGISSWHFNAFFIVCPFPVADSKAIISFRLTPQLAIILFLSLSCRRIELSTFGNGVKAIQQSNTMAAVSDSILHLDRFSFWIFRYGKWFKWWCCCRRCCFLCVCVCYIIDNQIMKISSFTTHTIHTHIPITNGERFCLLLCTGKWRMGEKKKKRREETAKTFRLT